MKTKEQELVELLDYVFDGHHETDWAVVQEKSYLSAHSSWLLKELFRLLALCADDQAAFDEEIWRLTNEAQ